MFDFQHYLIITCKISISLLKFALKLDSLSLIFLTVLVRYFYFCFFTLFPCDSVRCLQNMLFLLKRHLVLQEQNLKITLEDERSSQLL